MIEETVGTITMPTPKENEDTSAEIGKIAEALSKAQGEIKGAVKDAANPFFKSSYADLASVWDACRAALSKNGLAVVQTTTDCEFGNVRLVTRLIHSSGQWVKGVLVMKPKDISPQGFGSAITYARRYALAAMVGVAPEDDDGNAASAKDPAVMEKVAGAAKERNEKNAKLYKERMADPKNAPAFRSEKDDKEDF